MRHFILPRPVFAYPVAARSRRMPDPAATARLVAPPRCMQRPATRPGPAIGAVDMAPIAIAADEHLSAGSLAPRTEKAGHAAGDQGRNSRSRHAPADSVDARRHGCEDAPAIVPLHGVGHGAEAKLASDGSAPCLPTNPGRF